MQLPEMRGLLRVLSCGERLIKYSEAQVAQEALAELRKSGAVPNTLIILQHSPVYTIGKRGRTEDFRVPIEDVKAQGIDIHHVPRGGEVTYHGPGQLVAYPIVNLRELNLGARAYVEGLEDTIIRTLGLYGIHARGRVPGATGVWVGERKIAAIGVKISHGISSHGIALNVNTDLEPFKLIVPCGLADKEVTTMQQELRLSKAPSMEQIVESFVNSFMQQFKCGAVQIDSQPAACANSLDWWLQTNTGGNTRHP